MLIARFVVSSCLAGTILVSSNLAWSEDFPYKPIRVVTSGVGSAADFVARVASLGLAEKLGQQVIVDNRSSSIIPGQIVSQALPDGYTLLVHGATFWMAPSLQNTPYDPVKDFSPITMAASSPNILTVYPLLPATSVKELIALAKARPGGLNYASAASGSTSHLAAELFNVMAGIHTVRVPYTSNSLKLADLMSGQVHLTFSSASVVMPQIKTGRLKALAVSSAQPSALAPGLPTIAAAGLPGYESVSMFGIFAPAKLAAPVAARLNQEAVWAMNRAEVRDKLAATGVEAVGSSPDQTTVLMKSEMTRMGKVIQEAGIRLE